VYKINSIANEIFFITNGNIRLLDGHMNIMSVFKKDEILGMDDLNKYFAARQEEADMLKNGELNEESKDRIVKRKH